MKRCALLTCEDLENNILDEDRLERALEAKKWQYEWIPWTRDGVDWDSFDCALVRTTWDYTTNTPLFLQKLQFVAQSGCRLFNSYDTICRNTQKTYLKTFQDQGLPIIPTLWLHVEDLQKLQESVNSLAVRKVVLKPQVGAGAKNTFLVETDNDQQWKQAFAALVDQAIMVQPFMEQVVKQGEFSAHFFNKQLSHVVLKTPKANDFRSQEEFGSWVRKVDLTSSQLAFCEKILNQIAEPTLFARVDFICNEEGKPLLNELELIEPSLYFRYDESAAPKMVEALEKMMGID